MVALDRFTTFHKFYDLVRADWLKIVAIDSYIHRASANVRQASVAVPVKHPGSAIHVIPDSNRIVTHNDFLLVDATKINPDFVVMLRFNPPRIFRDSIAVMVPDNQPFVAVQLAQ